MALHARTAASIVVLVAALASPLAVAAQSRAVDAKPKRSLTARNAARPDGGAARARARAEARSQVAWDDDAVIRWEDQGGTVHYTRGSEVPQRFRPKARHVHATVGTVPMDRAETKKSAASLDDPASGAAMPAMTLPPEAALPSAAGTPQSLPSGASQSR